MGLDFIPEFEPFYRSETATTLRLNHQAKLAIHQHQQRQRSGLFLQYVDVETDETTQYLVPLPEQAAKLFPDRSVYALLQTLMQYVTPDEHNVWFDLDDLDQADEKLLWSPLFVMGLRYAYRTSDATTFRLFIAATLANFAPATWAGLRVGYSASQAQGYFFERTMVPNVSLI